ncbi:hypothetical protein L226DRAFT_540644, partial [Lentinus tigrinus ALCF2SS1-7]|uniref:uncharacterized protein n=1 Tax=Lentinus tigrinus ALCF2SS1-7 TaxID=1328758 RepID=UPI001165F229
MKCIWIRRQYCHDRHSYEKEGDYCGVREYSRYDRLPGRGQLTMASCIAPNTELEWAEYAVRICRLLCHRAAACGTSAAV